MYIVQYIYTYTSHNVPTYRNKISKCQCWKRYAKILCFVKANKVVMIKAFSVA